MAARIKGKKGQGECQDMREIRTLQGLKTVLAGGVWNHRGICWDGGSETGEAEKVSRGQSFWSHRPV